jgi:hypothetical protein
MAADQGLVKTPSSSTVNSSCSPLPLSSGLRAKPGPEPGMRQISLWPRSSAADWPSTDIRRRADGSLQLFSWLQFPDPPTPCGEGPARRIYLVRRRLTSSRVYSRPRCVPLQKMKELATGCEEGAASTTHHGAIVRVLVLGINDGRRVAIGAGWFLRHSISPSSRTAITAKGDDGSARGSGRGAYTARAGSKGSPRPRGPASTRAARLR